MKNKTFFVLLGFIFILSLVSCKGLAPRVEPIQSSLFLGSNAYEHVKYQTELGPRIPGSPQAIKLRSYITDYISKLSNWTIHRQPFTANTPLGKVKMENIVASFPGSDKKAGAFVVGAHYDTKLFKEFKFVGANDGASGVGVLLELARTLSSLRSENKTLKHTVILVFLDGEESFGQWSDDDSLYGSRFFVNHLKEQNKVKDIGAAVIVDMVGDKNLKVCYEINSHPELLALMFRAAHKLGYSANFPKDNYCPIDDDHIPFLLAGIPSVDMIGLSLNTSTPVPEYWHTKDDTLDKISKESLEIAGRTLGQLLSDLDGMLK